MADRPRNCGIDREGLPVWGYDYDLARWGTQDENGHIIWHEGELPSNRDWDDIRIVTLDFSATGEGDFRNYKILPERPLDPYGAWHPKYRGPHKCGRYYDTLGSEAYYDLDNLAYNAMLDYGLWEPGESAPSE